MAKVGRRRVPSPPSNGPGQTPAAAEHRLAANTSTSLVAGFLLREVSVWIDTPSITMFWSRAANTLDMRNAVASSSVLNLATVQNASRTRRYAQTSGEYTHNNGTRPFVRSFHYPLQDGHFR
jgi:hypothetical protein